MRKRRGGVSRREKEGVRIKRRRHIVGRGKEERKIGGIAEEGDKGGVDGEECRGERKRGSIREEERGRVW